MHKMTVVSVVFAAMVGAASPSFARGLSDGNVMQGQTLSVTTGDVLVQRGEADWSAVKIVSMDLLPDGTKVAHVLFYEASQERPTLASSAALSPRILHVPMDAEVFSTGWERLGNLPVTDGELSGFNAYLKQTDFPRYLEETGLSAEEIVAAANRNYQRGNALSEAGDHAGAIAAYDQAIELFPLFFEAIDNRAFSYMDLGRYDLALEGFEASLRVEPNGIAAFFSRGECLLRLGRLDEAEAVFREGEDRFPSKRSMFSEFLQLTRDARTG